MDVVKTIRMTRSFSQCLRRALGAAFGVLCLSFAAKPASAQPPGQDDNLLVNCGFEWPYNEDFRSDGGGFVAHGWNAWWYNDPGGDYDAPEFKGASIEEDAARVRDGVVAQQYFRPWALHMAGLWQRVPVPTDSHARFTVWGHAWSTFCADPGPNTPGLDCDPRNSFHGNVNPIAMKVGIDPTGGTDPFSASIVWSTEQAAYDNYQQFAIEVDAQGDFVTVFVYSRPEWAAPVISVYWDNAVLTASGQVSPPTRAPSSSSPSAQLTLTPTSTAAAEGTATAQLTSTPLPTNTPTLTPTQAEAGRICLSLFEDTNENGLREADELLLQGGTLNIEGRFTNTYQTDDTSEPFCVDHLTPGDYEVSVTVPEGYQVTTLDRVAVTISRGEVNLSFGAAADDSTGQTPQPTGGNPLMLIGVIAGGFLLAALGGTAAFISISRRRNHPT